MNPALIAIVMVLVTLAFIWMLWLRQQIKNQLKTLEFNEQLQQKEVQFQLDRAPIFLEKTRDAEQFQAAWTELKNQRTQWSRKPELSREEMRSWVQMLEAHLNTVQSSDWVAIDAREDMHESIVRFRELSQDYEQNVQTFNAFQKRFPWSVAFAIFGFRKIQL